MRYSSLALSLLLSLAAAPIRVAAQAPAAVPGWVVIPVAEYSALRARAFPAPADPAPPPVQATLTRVDYELHVNGDLATGRATLTVDVLLEGWVRIPIPAGLFVRDARLDGNLLPLVTADGKSSQPLALLSKKGRSVLVLDIALPVAASAGEEKLALPASVSGVTRATIAVTRQDLDVAVSGGILSEKSQAAPLTKWLAYGRAGESLTFTWRKKLEERHSVLPLRMRGSLTQMLSLGEDSTAVYAEINATVSQGAAKQMRIQVPTAVRVNQVDGATVADWEVKAGELVVSFLEPVEQTARFVITGEAALPREGAITAPLLALVDVERETGGVAVEVLGAGETKDVKTAGLDRTDAAELGAAIGGKQSPSLAAFRLRAATPAAQRSLSLTLVRYTPQAVLTAIVEEARYRVLLSQEGKTLVEARYAVKNNQRNFAKVTLPAGAQVWSSSLAGRPVRAGLAPDGGLLFPLTRARGSEETPASALEVLYLVRGTAWTDKGRASLTLPLVDLPVSRTGMEVYYPPLFRVTFEPGAFHTQQYQPPAATALNAPEPVPPPAPVQQGSANSQMTNSQMLVDNYRAQAEARRGAVQLPLRVPFPAVGPSLYLVAELSGDKAPTLELTYQKDKKGAGR